MIERNKQEVSNVSDSFVQQANGNIHNYGLAYSDVKAICHDVVRQELSIVTKEATDTFHQEITAFENQFVRRLENLENPQVMEKLRTPKLQFALHDTIKEYAKTDDAGTKEELIDSLIDRLKVNEHSTEQYLIDESIKIIPNLSLAQTYFLGALTLRKIINQGYSFIVDRNLAKRAELYEYLNEITTLDIQYLKLINCCSDMPGTKYYLPTLNVMKPDYDLLFRHHITDDIFYSFWHEHPNMPMINGKALIYKHDDTNEIHLLYSAKKYLIQVIERAQQPFSHSELDQFINLFTPLTDEEIKQHLISLNPNWGKAFNCLDKEEITQIDLTPVGLYIGRRIVQKVTKDDTLPLEDFYK